MIFMDFVYSLDEREYLKMDIMDELAKSKDINNGVFDLNKEEPYVKSYVAFNLNPKYTMYEKMLIIGLRSYQRNKADCYPSKATLSKQLNANIKTIEKLLKRLEELGALLIINRKKESNRKTSNLYILAEIDKKTGDFIPSSLDKFRYLNNQTIRVQGK